MKAEAFSMTTLSENIIYMNLFHQIEKIMKTPEFDEVLVMLLGGNGREGKKGARVIPPYNSNLNHAWYLVGVVFYKQERFFDALLAFKRSYRHWAEDISAIRAIGNCYSELGNPKVAKYYFIKAINMAGASYKGLDILVYNLGNAYFDLKKYASAISEYKKVRQSDRKSYDLAQKNINHAKRRLLSGGSNKENQGVSQLEIKGSKSRGQPA